MNLVVNANYEILLEFSRIRAVNKKPHISWNAQYKRKSTPQIVNIDGLFVAEMTRYLLNIRYYIVTNFRER